MRTITVNNQIREIPDEVQNLSSLTKFLNLQPSRTAYALNGRFVAKDKWDVTPVSNGDIVNVITAAFGG